MLTSFFTSLSNYHFLQNALITAVCDRNRRRGDRLFYYLTRDVLDGDAISHAVLPG